MKKRNEDTFETNNDVEELKGFVPVQYKILKLDADYIVSCPKKEIEIFSDGWWKTRTR